MASRRGNGTDVFVSLLSSQSLRGIWSQQMFSSSWVTSSWRLASSPTFPLVRLPPCRRRSRVPFRRPGLTPSSPASSASSAPATCRVCADITATGTEERSSSNAKTAPSSPATSKNRMSRQRITYRTNISQYLYLCTFTFMHLIETYI